MYEPAIRMRKEDLKKIEHALKSRGKFRFSNLILFVFPVEMKFDVN